MPVPERERTTDDGVDMTIPEHEVTEAVNTASLRTREGACVRSAQSDRRGIGGIRQAVGHGSRVGQARKPSHLIMEDEGRQLGDHHRRGRAMAVAATIGVGSIRAGRGAGFVIKHAPQRQFDPVPMPVPIISLGMEMDAQRHHQHGHHGHADGGMAKRLQQDAEEGTHRDDMLEDADGCQSLPASVPTQLVVDRDLRLCYFKEP